MNQHDNDNPNIPTVTLTAGDEAQEAQSTLRAAYREAAARGAQLIVTDRPASLQLVVHPDEGSIELKRTHGMVTGLMATAVVSGDGPVRLFSYSEALTRQYPTLEDAVVGMWVQRPSLVFAAVRWATHEGSANSAGGRRKEARGHR